MSKLAVWYEFEFVFCNFSSLFNKIKSPEEIFNGLLYFGAFYTMEIEVEEFYALDQMHNILLQYYNGSYVIQELMTLVSFIKYVLNIKYCCWEIFSFTTRFQNVNVAKNSMIAL